ncbi:hypothetical protein GGI15_002908 [Coemansia interrupta]|uniref:SET domain-containing protein n=1 Tax=Coemansia interrupta TaxID=1126814 RepID=A0A9W8LIZ5_9FUNG|nr:hypothetical protein GGI15_002908 [Coemansia interrupta]
MFNHEPFGHQNVGFTRDMSQNIIKYTALRDISAGEELCICYGPNVWFDMVSENQQGDRSNGENAGDDDDMPSAEDFLQGIDIA